MKAWWLPGMLALALALAGCYDPSLPLSDDAAGGADASADAPGLTGDGAPCSVVYQPSYVDDFDSGILPSTLATGAAAGGNTDVSGGALRLYLPGGVAGVLAHAYSVSAFDLTDKAMTANLIDGPVGVALALFVVENESSQYGFLLQGGILTWGAIGVATASEPWDGTDRWFRIRDQGGTVLAYDASPDGASWRLLGTTSGPFWINSASLLLEASAEKALGAADDVVFDDLNSPPICP